MIDSILDLATRIIDILGYPGIFLIMGGKNLFPIVPSEVIMPFAGFLAAEGRLSFTGILLAGALGTTTGALVVYYLSRRLGEERLKEWIRKHGKYVLLWEEDIEKGLNAFDRHGNLYLMFGRVIPGARYVVPIPAGLRKMKPLTFFVLALGAALIWNTPLAFAGLWLGRNWEDVADWISSYELIILAVLAAIILVFLAKRIRRVIPT